MPVVVAVVAPGRSAVERTHDAADDLAVDDVGCLVVTTGDGKNEKTVAVYAPGVWLSGEVRE